MAKRKKLRGFFSYLYLTHTSITDALQHCTDPEPANCPKRNLFEITTTETKKEKIIFCIGCGNNPFKIPKYLEKTVLQEEIAILKLYCRP